MKMYKFYDRKLNQYFEQNFKEYEDTAEWYVNPAPNMWKFELPGFGVVILTCDDDGKITKEVTRK